MATVWDFTIEGNSKLPPGVTKTSLAKGATSMTSSTYKKTPVGSTTPSPGGDIYICVLTAMPDQPGFVDGIATSIKTSTSGTMTSACRTIHFLRRRMCRYSLNPDSCTGSPPFAAMRRRPMAARWTPAADRYHLP